MILPTRSDPVNWPTTYIRNHRRGGPRIRCTVIFLTAGCAMISDVNAGVLFSDMVTKLTTPAGRPAYHEASATTRSPFPIALFTDFVQSIHDEGRGIRAIF
jgi:hypothetical protein